MELLRSKGRHVLVASNASLPKCPLERLSGFMLLREYERVSFAAVSILGISIKNV